MELGVFNKVKVSFLMVGHTHENVDQVFSRYVIFSIMLKLPWISVVNLVRYYAETSLYDLNRRLDLLGGFITCLSKKKASPGKLNLRQ